MTTCIDYTVDDLAGLMAGDRLGPPLSRRLFLAGTAAFSLAACGGNNSTAEPPSAGAAGFPVTLQGKEGMATIPAEPRRVIAVGYQRDTDTALALGVTPIAIAENSLYPNLMAPWVEAELGNLKPELLNTTNGLPFEKIAALRPDLILATDDYELAGNHTRLTQIAPTLSYLEGPESDTWKQRTTHIGKALGRDEQAQKVITDIEALIAQAAQANPDFAGKTFSRSYAYEGEVRTLTRGDAGVELLEELGLRLLPEVAALPSADTPGRAAVSRENLSVLEADVMMFSYPTSADQTFLESNPLFQQLDAVRNGTYIRFDQEVATSLAFPSALSIPYGLDRTVTAVAKVLA